MKSVSEKIQTFLRRNDFYKVLETQKKKKKAVISDFYVIVRVSKSYVLFMISVESYAATYH